MFQIVHLCLLYLFYTSNLAYADDYSSNVWSQSQNGVGASIVLSQGHTSETGFKATVYSFPFNSFWNFGYIGASYTTNSVIASADSVVSPNFSMTGRNSYNPDGYDFYGLSGINMNNILIELKGYYLGKL